MPYGIPVMAKIKAKPADNPKAHVNYSKNDSIQDKKAGLSMVSGMKQFYVPIAK